ncbi:MAG: hypothetical protein GX674_12190, partial [Clostridiales bacterium]|nr:hypothetical protein [Clostridiales bacterium]
MARLQAGQQLRSEEELGNAAASLEQYGDYQKAVRFADEKLKPVYFGYNQRILNRLEEERKEGIYQAASKQYRGASDEAGYRQAAGTFRSIPRFKDADERALASQAKAEEARLAKLKREEEEWAEQSRREAERAAQAERERIAAEKRRARNKRMAMIITPLVLAAIGIALLLTQVVIPRGNYQKAMDLLNSKQYDQASEAFKALGDYSDSAVMVQQSIYQKGIDYLANKQYDQAVAVFETLGSYSDSVVMVSESKYQKAKSFQENGQFDEAIRLFEGLGSYSNASSIVRQAQADKLYVAGDYVGAYAIYSTLEKSYQTHETDYAAMYASA